MRVDFGFSNAIFSTVLRFPFARFQLPQCWHERSTGSCPHFYQTFKMLWQIFRADSYKQLLQYTPLKSFTVPSALLTKFPKFHMKLLASDIIFTKLSTKTLLLWRCRVSFEYQGLCSNTPASFLLLFVNVQASLLTALQKSSNIYVAGVQHDVNTSRKRRRRDADIRSAAAARRRRRTSLIGRRQFRRHTMRSYFTGLKRFVSRTNSRHIAATI